MPSLKRTPTNPSKHKPAEPVFGLSKVEIALLRSLCEGRTTEAAAAHIGISKSMAAEHTLSMKNKMECYHMVCAAIKAERAGLLDGVLADTKREALSWQTAGMPDADENVLLTLQTSDGPEVWPGYWNGQQWLQLDGMPTSWPVMSWAKWPAGHNTSKPVHAPN